MDPPATTGPLTPIRGYASELLAAFNNLHDQIPPGIASEQEFKRKIIVPLAVRLGSKYARVSVCTPPWGNRVPCGADGHGGSGEKPVELGCPICWA